MDMENRGRRRAGMLPVLACLLLLTACWPGDDASPPAQPTAIPQTPGTSPTPGGEGSPSEAAGGAGILRWSNEGTGELDSLDPPGTQSSNSVMAAGLIFEGLVRLDSRLNIVPAGAEKWDISEDGLTYTFHIREGLKWADGSEVTSEDFRYSLERALSKEFATGSSGYYLSNIVGAEEWLKGEGSGLSGVTTDGPDKLVIKVIKPGAHFLDQLTHTSASAVPRKLIEQHGDTWTDQAWGTGPFKVKEWKHNQGLSLEPNPNYWLGTPQLAGIEMPFIADPEEAYSSYMKGALDIMGSQQFPPARVAETQGTPGFKQVPQFFTAYVGFNNKKAPFDNVHLRRALAMSVDKGNLAEQVLAGTVLATDHIVPQGMPGYNESLQPLGFDPAKAKEELAQAGSVGKVKLAYTTGQVDFDKVAAALQAAWKEHLGLDVELDAREQNKFNDDLTAMANNPEASDIEMYISVWGADYPDPQNFLTQQLHTGQGNNNGHWSDPEFDRLTDQADTERETAARMSLYNQAEQIAIDKVGWLPLYNGEGKVLIRPTVEGIAFTAQGIFADDWSKVTVSSE